MAHIITFGNEKGGSGKSTTAMHVFAAAAHSGYKVGILDLDLRQLSLQRYVENRVKTAQELNIDLPMPIVFQLAESQSDSRITAQSEEEGYFTEALTSLEADCDLIMIDCPGSNSNFARMAHSVADLLVTPINESFVDFDMLAHIDPNTDEITGPSAYAEIVWEARKLRKQAGLEPLDWIIVRNRMSTSDAKNRRRVSAKLKEFSQRIGFRTAPGLSERVIYRELFTQGLTLLDLHLVEKRRMSLSSVAARQEMRELISQLRLSKFKLEI